MLGLPLEISFLEKICPKWGLNRKPGMTIKEFAVRMVFGKSV